MKKILIFLSVLLLSFFFVANADEVYIRNLRYDKKPVRVLTAETLGFYKYSNERFSFKTYVPDCVKWGMLHENGDSAGASFMSIDTKVIFDVNGRNKIYNNTPRERLEEFVKNLDAIVTYRACGDNWFAVSWVEEDGYVYYKKEIVKPETAVLLLFLYPYAQKEKYDWMIPILESNFTFL